MEELGLHSRPKGADNFWYLNLFLSSPLFWGLANNGKLRLNSPDTREVVGEQTLANAECCARELKKRYFDPIECDHYTGKPTRSVVIMHGPRRLFGAKSDQSGEWANRLLTDITKEFELIGRLKFHHEPEFLGIALEFEPELFPDVRFSKPSLK